MVYFLLTLYTNLSGGRCPTYIDTEGGTGKTTLTKLFSALESGSLSEYQSLEYEIVTETGIFKQNQNYDRNVRVFNQDYISNNINLFECEAESIFILGEENKALAEQIEVDEKNLYGDPAKPRDIGKLKKLREQKNLRERKEKEKGQNFTNIAKIIGKNTSGVTPRNYRKPQAEKAFNLLADKELLDEIEENKYSITLKQEEIPAIEEIKIPEVNNRKSCQSIVEVLKELLLLGKEICSMTVESVIIERLKDNSDISEWVETGLSIHRKHKSQKCEFCDQSLPEDRIKELAGYFNEADQKLKNKIDELIGKLRKIYSLIESIKFVDKANFYKEFQKKYQSSINVIKAENKNLLKAITEFGGALKDKKSKTTELVNLEIELDTDSFSQKLIAVNDFIIKHNKKTNNFQKEKDGAQKKLETHYLSSIYDEVKTKENEIDNCIKEEKGLQDGDPNKPNDLGIAALQKRIAENRNIISSSHKACGEINEKLKTFLGRDEIVFEVAEKGGYLIKRNGKIAKNLSEGEKTAIAFVYFTVHLQDQNFNLEEGIVVIDDPVSSLDSNSTFQAFAFLKNAVKEAKQVFIFTHNFDFLRLLLNWLKNVPKREGKKRFLMIKNKFSIGSNREAFIAELDEELKNHESEYHYLFKMLLEYESNGTIASIYHIPNIARKVLETFLMFRVPNNKNVYNKLESLDFDENKKTAIYKFTNDLSHITGKGFDPSLVPETQKNVQYLLEMMKAVFPEHYDILEASVNN